MARGKKIGVILILVSLCIPMLAMLFANWGYHGRDGVWRNAKYAGIVIWEREKPRPEIDFSGLPDKRIVTTAELFGNPHQPNVEYIGPLKTKETYYVPCRYLFGLGIILVAIGIGLVILSDNGKEKKVKVE